MPPFQIPRTPIWRRLKCAVACVTLFFRPTFAGFTLLFRATFVGFTLLFQATFVGLTPLIPSLSLSENRAARPRKQQPQRERKRSKAPPWIPMRDYFPFPSFMYKRSL